MTPPAILELRNVSKSYPAVAGDAADLLKGIDLTVTGGQSLAIVGPSGCGKSTLLNIIGALDKPTAGQVILEGQDLSQLTEQHLCRLRNRSIGFVFQMHHLLPQCTVLENVLVPTLANAKGEAPGAIGQRAAALLERVGLGSRLAHRPGQLSGGERQRVALVRALINNPSILLADEPTGSLDAAAAGSLADLMVEINLQQHVTLIVVTHSIDLARRMQTVYELVDGRLKETQADNLAGPHARQAPRPGSGQART